MEQKQFASKKDWFDAFIANTDQKRVQLEALIEGLQTRHIDLWHRVVDPDYDLDVLLIGAGQGTSEIPSWNICSYCAALTA